MLSSLVTVGLLAMMLGGCAVGVSQTRVQVEIVLPDESTADPSTEEVLDLVEGFSHRVVLTTYRLGTVEGDLFVRNHDLSDRTALAVLIDGETEFEIVGRPVAFVGIPRPSGPGEMVAGEWTLDDLRIVLEFQTFDSIG